MERTGRGVWVPFLLSRRGSRVWRRTRRTRWNTSSLANEFLIDSTRIWLIFNSAHTIMHSLHFIIVCFDRYDRAVERFCLRDFFFYLRWKKENLKRVRSDQIGALRKWKEVLPVPSIVSWAPTLSWFFFSSYFFFFFYSALWEKIVKRSQSRG